MKKLTTLKIDNNHTKEQKEAIKGFNDTTKQLESVLNKMEKDYDITFD